MNSVVLNIIIVFVGARMVIHTLDQHAVLRAAAGKGYRDIGITWIPFPSGWLWGNMLNYYTPLGRVYRVTFLDDDRQSRERHCHCTFLRGVLWI